MPAHRDSKSIRDLAALSALGIASLAAHWGLMGVRLGGDSGRYLDAGRRLLAGAGLTGKQPDFLGYDALVAATQGLGGGLNALVAAQCLLSILAGLLLYLAGRGLWGRRAGLWCAALFLINPDLQRWSLYVLADGPFASLLALATALALLTARDRAWAQVALGPALLWLALTRPEGGLFVVLLGAYVLARGHRLIGLGGLFCGAAVFLAASLLGGTSEEIPLRWREGVYIWGHTPWPPPPGTWEGVGTGLAGTAWHSFSQAPLWTLGLLGRRILWLALHARPFYSLAHNLLAAGLALITLVAAAWATLVARSIRSEVWLLWGLAALQAGLTLLTWADWDGRFFTRIWPLLCLIAVSRLEPREPATSS